MVDLCACRSTELAGVFISWIRIMSHWDRRSAEAAEYRKLYNTRRWRDIRASQLCHEPSCRMCAAAGRLTPATVCDHIEPHRGDIDKFWNGPFQSLCDQDPWRCHSRGKQSEEVLGYSKVIGADGWPTDGRHPFNRPVKG